MDRTRDWDALYLGSTWVALTNAPPFSTAPTNRMHHSTRNVDKTLVLVWAEFTSGPWLLLTIVHPEAFIETSVQLVSGRQLRLSEVVARAIHNQSLRNRGPFVKLNYAAICSRVRSSATKEARSQERLRKPKADSNWRTRAHSSSTKSAMCRWSCNRYSSALRNNRGNCRGRRLARSDRCFCTWNYLE